MASSASVRSGAHGVGSRILSRHSRLASADLRTDTMAPFALDKCAYQFENGCKGSDCSFNQTNQIQKYTHEAASEKVHIC